jgi:hypothetical protein
LGGPDQFQAITLKRPGIGNWHRPKLIVRSKVQRSAKIAIFVFVETADITEHNADVDLGARIDSGLFRLHRNTADITLTLPSATKGSADIPGTAGTEIFIHAPSAAHVMTLVPAVGDTITRGAKAFTSVVSNQANARLILSCENSKEWKIDRFTKPRWDLTP